MFTIIAACAVLAAACDIDESRPSITGLDREVIAPRLALSGGTWSVELIAVGGLHACAIEADGDAYCWGANGSGQVGDGSTNDKNVPTLVVGAHDFMDVDAGQFHSCAIDQAQAAWCWGSNSDGQLGDGTMTDRATPVRVAGGHSFTTITAGGDHTCALDVSGAAWCWGDHTWAQLGHGAPAGDLAPPPYESTEPVPVAGGRRFTSLESWDTRTCALDAGGEAYCWGYDHGRDTFVSSPRIVPSPTRFLSIAANPNRVCGVGTDRLAYCRDGDDAEARPAHPTHQFEAVSDRGEPCGLDTAGDLYCWNDASELASINSGNQIAAFSGSPFFRGGNIRDNLCALDEGGVAYCWGDNEFGQLGDGTNTNRASPTPVSEPRTTRGDARGVNDLRISAQGATTTKLTWTQVDDGTGRPARYRVRYGSDLTNWKTGTIGCASTIRGTAIGASISCTVTGLAADTRYEYQLMSFRTVNGAWVDARFSNLVVGETASLVVDDLRVTERTSAGPRTGDGRTRVSWTEVDDGTANPARYRLRHAEEIGNWKEATIACSSTIRGDGIGTHIECLFDSSRFYADSQTFELQLMSFRVDSSGAWRNARYSNVAVAPPAPFSGS
jgi:hypothetical protein